MSAERAVRPRLRKDAELNRLRILAAAREVFRDRGVAATLNDVAHHAGVGVGTVYRRFSDKEELIDALFADMVNTAMPEHVVSIVAAALNDKRKAVKGARAERITVSPACVAINARMTRPKSPRRPNRVLMTRKLGRLNANVAMSKNGTLAAE